MSAGRMIMIYASDKIDFTRLQVKNPRAGPAFVIQAPLFVSGG